MKSGCVFVLFYVSVISVALFGSIYTSSLNAWNHVVFTFPPETQKVVENGTAVMEIRWRWFPEALEVTVKIKNDETNATFPITYKNETLYNQRSDVLTFLFDLITMEDSQIKIRRT